MNGNSITTVTVFFSKFTQRATTYDEISQNCQTGSRIRMLLTFPCSFILRNVKYGKFDKKLHLENKIKNNT